MQKYATWERAWQHCTWSATYQLASIRSLGFTLRIGSRHFFLVRYLSSILYVIWPAWNLSEVKVCVHLLCVAFTVPYNVSVYSRNHIRIVRKEFGGQRVLYIETIGLASATSQLDRNA